MIRNSILADGLGTEALQRKEGITKRIQVRVKKILLGECQLKAFQVLQWCYAPRWLDPDEHQHSTATGQQFHVAREI